MAGWYGHNWTPKRSVVHRADSARSLCVSSLVYRFREPYIETSIRDIPIGFALLCKRRCTDALSSELAYGNVFRIRVDAGVFPKGERMRRESSLFSSG